MGLLTKLKSLLGFEDDRSGVRRTESGVTIEREPDESPEPDAETESAVKGVDTDESRDASETPSGTEPEVTDAEPAAGEEAETDEEPAGADVSTEDVTTASEGAERVETGRDDAAEPSEAVDPSVSASEPAQTAGDEPEPTPEETSDESAAAAGEAEAGETSVDVDEDSAEPDDATAEADEADDEPVGEGEPLEDVKGIGPAYAERLQDAGVANVTELAKADAQLLAEETGLSEKRISRWIERAQAR